MSDPEFNRRLRVWFVNDDVALAEQIYRTFRDDFDVALFLNTAAATRAMEEGAFEAIVSDYDVMGRGGLEVLRCARSQCPRATRILIAGQRIPSLRTYLVSRLVHGFFPKPLKFDELQTRILALQRAPTRHDHR